MHNLNFIDNLILGSIVISCFIELIILIQHGIFIVIGVSLIFINTKINELYQKITSSTL